MEAEIAAILAPRWVSRVVSATLTGNEPAGLRLGVRTSAKARAVLEEELFGTGPRPRRSSPTTAPKRSLRATFAR